MAEKQSSQLTSDDLFKRLLRHLAIVEDADGIGMLNDALEAQYRELAEIAQSLRRL